jgi:ribosomal protein S18 acetylase RimI-like enzyme
MRIERATPEDAEVIARLSQSIHQLHCELSPEYFVSAVRSSVVSELRSMLSEAETCGLLAWEGDNPIGYCLLKVIGREPNAWTCGFRRLLVDQISVEPEWRRRGVGRLLMEAAFQFARDQGIEEVFLEYWSNNELARAFYASLGFSLMTEKVMLKVAATSQ